jgi:hypothetical protein
MMIDDVTGLHDHRRRASPHIVLGRGSQVDVSRIALCRQAFRGKEQGD